MPRKLIRRTSTVEEFVDDDHDLDDYEEDDELEGGEFDRQQTDNRLQPSGGRSNRTKR